VRKYLIFIIIFVFSIKLYTQDKSMDSSRSSWWWSLGASGFYMKGNTNKLYTTGAGEIKKQDSISTLDLLLSLDYGATNKIKDQNNFFGDFSADLFHYNTFSPLILQIGEFGYSRGIVFRSETGGGAKYNFIKHPEHKTSVSLALIYDYTNLVHKPGNNNGRTWRFSWRFKTNQKLFGDRIRIGNVTFFQPSVRSIQNVIWRSESTLEAPIVKGFSLMVVYLFTHDDIVSVGRMKTDQKVSFGLKVSAGKDNR
jgi:hypothetical protein